MAKPARSDHVPTVSEIVRRAVEACDPADTDSDLGRFEAIFEDDDEPVTAVSRLDERIAMAVEGIDYDLDRPAVSMAVAVTLYLWHRRDAVSNDDEELLRLAARAEWDGKPPEAVRDWLAARGVDV
jgi:hypothetical protein